MDLLNRESGFNVSALKVKNVLIVYLIDRLKNGSKDGLLAVLVRVL